MVTAVPTTPKRGRPRRLAGEPLRRVVVYLGAESEFPRLVAAAQMNGTTLSDFLRDAANDAAEECGAPPIFLERRRHARRAVELPIIIDRRQSRRREEDTDA